MIPYDPDRVRAENVRRAEKHVRDGFERWWKAAGAQYARRSVHHRAELKAVAWAAWRTAAGLEEQ